MSRFVLLKDNTVTEVQLAETSPGEAWMETNEYGVSHHKHGVFVPEINWKYNPEYDTFIPPSPYPSWTFDFSKTSWTAPITRPQLEWPQVPRWNESTLNWDIITIVE